VSWSLVCGGKNDLPPVARTNVPVLLGSGVHRTLLSPTPAHDTVSVPVHGDDFLLVSVSFALKVGPDPGLRR
jgi:hypothetical protein